jgi:hypothetical protein
VASNYPEEGRPGSDGGDPSAKLPFRASGPDHPIYAEARAELRDRETYYTELRFAVHCQSRSIPAPRAALDNQGSDTWARDASGISGISGETWDEMVARFGDTWT